MNKILMLASAFCAFAMIAGCASNETKVDANYQAYMDGVVKQDAAVSSKIDSLALAAASCGGDARCVENVVAFAALAAAGGSGNHAAPQPYQAKPSLGAQVALALVGNLAPLATAAVQWHQADESTKTSIAQYQYLGGVLTTSLNQMGNVAANAKPNITVGGNFGQTGDNVGGDQTNTGRDYIPGTGNNNAGNYGNDNRQGSPGPIGPTCTGDTCQGVPPATGG